jgi:hypothetical protein
MEWISIVSDDDEDLRRSSLGWSDKDPMFLRVTGVLPHNYKFEPSSVEDAELFIEYLENWIAEETA